VTVHTERAYLGPINQFMAPKITDAQYIERFKARCSINERGCWVHSGRQSRSRGMRPGAPGYIQVNYRGVRWMLHRLMYTLHKGPIPERFVVAHECDNPPCCNPSHLKAVTELENSADMIAKGRNYEQQRTHCPRGHAYDELNTEYKRAKSGRLARECRTCTRERHRRKWHRRKNIARPDETVTEKSR